MQSVQEESTVRTDLAGRIPPIGGDKLTAIPGRLVFQHEPKFRPGRVGDRTGQLAVPNHAGHIQVLDHDRLVLTNEPSGELVQEISTTVGDPCVDARDPKSGPSPVVGSFLLTCQPSLCASEPHLITLTMPRVGDLLPCRQCDQAGDTSIDTDRGSRWSQVSYLGLNQQRQVPPASRVTRHGHSRRLGPFGQRTRPANRQRSVHFGQPKLPVAPAERRSGVLRRRLPTLPGLEPWVLRASAPEVGECALQVPQALLQRHRRHVVEERQIISALPLRQQRRRLAIGHAAPLGVPGTCPDRQGLVVHQPDAAKGLQQLPFLRSSWREPIPVRTPDFWHDSQTTGGTHELQTSTTRQESGSSRCRSSDSHQLELK